MPYDKTRDRTFRKDHNDKYMKKAKKELLPVPIIPEILFPSAIPQNKQQWTDQRAMQIDKGELTYKDIGDELKLDEQDIEFCKMYASGALMGNAHECAMLVLGIDQTSKAERFRASQWHQRRLKAGHPCLILINVMLRGAGLNEANLDRQLLFIAEQKVDLKAAVLATRELNELAGRKKKIIEVNHNVQLNYDQFSKKQLQDLIKLAEIGLPKEGGSKDGV